jgi:cold shock CspA family protein
MKGTVLFWKDHVEKRGGFGFIAPEGEQRREMNFWFGPKAIRPLNGRVPRAGDIVEFEQGNFKPGKGPQASVILAILDDRDDDRDEIVYVGGD